MLALPRRGTSQKCLVREHPRPTFDRISPHHHSTCHRDKPHSVASLVRRRLVHLLDHHGMTSEHEARRNAGAHQAAANHPDRGDLVRRQAFRLVAKVGRRRKATGRLTAKKRPGAGVTREPGLRPDPANKHYCTASNNNTQIHDPGECTRIKKIPASPL